jgi:hypothetical protein
MIDCAYCTGWRGLSLKRLGLDPAWRASPQGSARPIGMAHGTHDVLSTLLGVEWGKHGVVSPGSGDVRAGRGMGRIAPGVARVAQTMARIGPGSRVGDFAVCGSRNTDADPGPRLSIPESGLRVPAQRCDGRNTRASDKNNVASVRNNVASVSPVTVDHS